MSRARISQLPDFLERGPLSLVSTTEALLGRNSSGSGLESLEYGRGDPFADHATQSQNYICLHDDTGVRGSVVI
jgi:hypothetical protein